jgi:hypothetical protein
VRWAQLILPGRARDGRGGGDEVHRDQVDVAAGNPMSGAARHVVAQLLDHFEK